ncbi:keratin-associated protein 15-1 [Equus przewalskii]|uniref:Keratin-associated protein n=1 Tax=Equus przewalskii TaxID=9798 RepID=A0ABM2FGR9_EQUPR|nr:keratin-associated protein 15-1 [Equus caballus]XP_008535698.1 PREDICTED: keratin-associated protein 15-1 [Equus przewalskii]
MSYNCSSGNFSARSLGGYLRYPVSTFDSFSPSNVVYSPSACQLGSSLYDGCQGSLCEPTSCQPSCAVARSHRTSCFRPKNFIFYSPCQTNYTGSLGCGNIGLGSFGYGSTGFQSLGCGSSFLRPTCFSSRSCQSTCYRPAFGSRFFGSTF